MRGRAFSGAGAKVSLLWLAMCERTQEGQGCHGRSGYGLAAARAVAGIRQRGLSAPKAWKAAVASVFPHSRAARDKPCPRCAFLGLCQEGRVVGVRPGEYTRSRLNLEYAPEAHRVLRLNPALAEETPALWREALRPTGRNVVHNNQLDVVLALWQAGLLEAP